MKNFQLKFVKNRSLVRWLQLLNEFEKNPSCTLGELAEVTSSSTRTLIADIANIRNYFEGALEIHSSKSGYFFEETHPDHYIKKKQELVRDEPIFMILESIFFNELQSILDWSILLNLSEQSLLSYLKKIEVYLKPFDISISTNPVNFIGSETDIRRFFCLFYYESDINVNTIFPSIEVQNAVMEITDFLQVNSQRSSFSYFSYILYIALERSKNGLSVNPPNKLKELVYRNCDFFDYNTIIKIVYKHFGIKLSENETIYLTICILCRRKINDSANEEFCIRYNQWPEIKQIAIDFYNGLNESGMSFDEEQDILWLESFFTVIKLKELLSDNMNVNLDDLNQFVQKKFNEEYKRNYNFLRKNKEIKKIYQLNHLEDICSSLTLHTETIKEENWGINRNIAVIFEGNEYVCEYAESIIRKYLGVYHKIYYPDANELSQEYLEEKGIDLLVTNYSEYITEFLLNVECILLKAIPDASDWNRLLNKINPRILRLVVLENI
ncbi:helix-turn-helix domain-containing protein [Enterococcus casseliflavus]|uniref:helix-turn-helix domain-containing protein n=1 Tax=Enterococcus casseliflavus TaxID=37734 RepID=UPI001BD0A788|nr:helix-turn-helix domain-containing protein [Enterococcus casseliflavus]